MRSRFVVLFLAISSVGLAEPGKTTAGTDGVTVSADGTRHDPKGVQGIGPFWTALQAGDRAFIARKYEEALVLYQKAIEESPRDALGHYRAGQASTAKGDLAGAEAAYQASLRYANTAVMKGKLLFVLADLRERQGQYDSALEAWTRVQAFAQAEQEVTSLATAATERIQRIETRAALAKQYAEVKARIDARKDVQP